MPRNKGSLNITKKKDKINKDEFEELCRIQCTETEIASVFGVSHDLIYQWCCETYGMTFKEVFQRYKDIGKVALRRLQFKQAEKSMPMSLWLGKQWLGQTDKVDFVDMPKIQIISDVPKKE